MDKLEGYKTYLLHKGKSLGTIEKHSATIKYLLKTLPDLEIATLEQFFFKLFEKGYAPAYLNNFVMTIRHWGDYTGRDYRSIKYFTVRETTKSTMSDKEIEEFLTLPCLEGFDKSLHETYTLFFKILAYSGMRPGEVMNLTVNGIDFGRGVIILERTKTIPRLVPMAPIVSSDLTVYIRTLKGERLFPSVGRHKWKHHFQERIKRLGIKRNNLSTYSLRHSFITRMLDEDVNLMKVQKIVGHARIETTAHYTHLTTKDIVNAIKKDPLSKASLPLYERMKIVREGIFKLIEAYSNSPEEEKQMAEGLKVF